jgi:Zn-dependent protease
MSLRDAYNPFYVPQPAPHAGRPRITFSRDEVIHLLGAVAILTFCFAFLREGGLIRKGILTFPPWGKGALAFPPWVDVFSSFLAVGSGFVLHELAHKVVAQRYGHWAEFRAQFRNLFISLALVAGTGILIAAPGAVIIQGNVTRRENGLISLVGPGMNFVIAAATFPFAYALNPDLPLPRTMGIISTANAFLCIFNLIPLGPLDGRKVMRWNPFVYLGAVVAALGFGIALWLTGVWHA